MNIATGILEAPVVKTAGVAELMGSLSSGLLPSGMLSSGMLRSKFVPLAMEHTPAMLMAKANAAGNSTAGVAELLELVAKGSIPKFLPEVMAKNQALMAGSGAISGDVVRRFLRARGAGNLASGTAGILAGLGTGGYAGGAGALASMAPALAGRTSDVAIPRILAATAGGAGIEHLIRMGIESNPGAIASGVGDAVKAIAAPVTRGVQGATVPISTNSAQELASSLGSKGLSELRGLIDSFSGGTSNIGSQALSEAGDINLYKNLFGTGVAGAGILGGINHFKPGSAMATLNFLRNRSKPLLAGTAGAGLALAGAPTIGAAAMLGALGAPIVNSTGVRRAARGLYNMSPGGAVAAGLGGTAALLGAPVLAGGLGATALAYNPTFRRLSAGGANLGWSGLKGGANLGWSGLKGGANLGWSGAKGVGRGALATAKYTGALPGRAGRAFASIPSGYGIGGAGLAATMLGMPAVGVPAMLAAPFFNPKASAALGDIARTLNKSKATQNELNALYKTSSVKLAAPVFTTGASYILDAPVMTKEALVGELVGAAVGATTRFLSERGTSLLEAGGNQLRKLRPHVPTGQFGFGGRSRLLNRTTQQLQRGATESGQVLTEQAAKQRAEAFLRGPVNSEVTLNAPRGAWFDTGTLYQGSDDILRARIDEGTQAAGWNPMQRFRNVRQRRQNIRNIEEQAYQAGRSGTTTPLTASSEPINRAQESINRADREIAKAQQARANAERGVTYNQSQIDAAINPARTNLETAQQTSEQASAAYNQAREQYFQTHFNMTAPTQTLEQAEAEVERLTRLRSVSPESQQALESATAVRDAIKQYEAASTYRGTTGLGKRDVQRLLSATDEELATELSKLQAAKTTGSLRPAERNRLNLLQANVSGRTQQLPTDPGEFNKLVHQTLSRTEREALGLPGHTPDINRTMQPDQVREQILSALDDPSTDPVVVERVRGLMVEGPATFNRDALNEALGEHSRGIAYTKGTSAPGRLNTALEQARYDVTQNEAALEAAEQSVARARERLSRSQFSQGTHRGRQRSLEAQRTYEQSMLSAATEARTQTQTALNAPVLTRTRANNLDNLAAPVNEALVKSKAKPEVLEALQLRGLDGISPEMAEQLSILQRSGVDTAKLINNAAKRSGLPKAVTQVNKAADNLVNEALAASGRELNPEQLEIIQGVVKDLGTRGEQLTIAKLENALSSSGGTLPTEVRAVLTEVQNLAGSGAGVGAEFTNATRNLGEVFAGGEKSFGTQLGNEFSKAQGIAADAGYANLRKGVQTAGEEPGFFKRRFTNRPNALKGEDLEAIEAVEALTNARIQAMESAIVGQGGNAALVQAARPQMYEASAAVARSGNPEIARAWSRVLQEPGNLQANIQNNPQLNRFLTAEAPELMEAARQNSRAFNLGVEQAEQLSNLIPKGGRGSAENLTRELEKGFSKETFRDLNSPRAQESLAAMQSANSTFAKNMRTMLESGDEVANSAANKVLSGTRNAGEFTTAELSQLTGVNAPNITDRGVIRGVITNSAKANAAQGELTRIAGSSADKSTKDILKQIDDEIARLKKDSIGSSFKNRKGKPKTTKPNPRIEALQDARRVVEREQSRVQRDLTSNYTTHMSTSRRNLETTIKADSRVDMTKLKRNTEVGKVKVESTSFDELYQQPVLNAEGAVEFTPADIEKQFKQLKSLRQNGNTSDEVVLARVIEENLSRLQAQGVTDPQQLNSARANLESIVAGLETSATPEAVRAAAGRGGMGAMGNLATGAAVVGGTGYAASRPGPSPATTARAGTMQPQASWGLNPLQAPVRYIKKTAMSAPTKLGVPKPKFTPNDVTKAPVKHTSIPATSLMTATTDSISKISMLQAPIRAW